MKPWVYWYWMQANATRDGITQSPKQEYLTKNGKSIISVLPSWLSPVFTFAWSWCK